MSASGLLTEGELELMAPLWSLGEGTVHEVRAALGPERDLAYTTVSTVLRILERKGFVTATKRGRSHVYRPTVSKTAYQATALRHTLGRLFGGRPSDLVRQLLDTSEVDPDELDAIEALLEQHREDPS